MEEQKNQQLDYAYAIRQYKVYGRGRSMKEFCEEEGYDYAKFCRTARKGQKGISIISEDSVTEASKSDDTKVDNSAGFVPLSVEEPKEKSSYEERLKIESLRIRLSNGLEVGVRGGSLEEMLRVVRKIVR